MNAKETRSDAEKYRQERKERIKKDAAKTKKGTGKGGAVLRKIIAIVLCVVIAGGVIWYLADFFGWPQKLTTVATVNVDGEEYKISQAKFNFYYSAALNEAVNSSYQSSQYGLTSGFDYTQSPDSQTTTDDEGNEITYAEKFKLDAIDSIEQTLYYAKKAKDENVELTSHELSEVEATMDTMRENADASGYSLSAFIILNYGKGLNANLFEEYLEEQMMAHRYAEYLQEKYAAEYTDEQINEEYDADPNAYNNIDVRVYGFSIEEETDEDGNTIEPEYTEEEQLQRAQEMISRVTDEESFKTLCLEYCTEEEVEDFRDGDASLARGMSYDTVSANMGEEEADWAFSADRQAGETTVWQTDSYIYAVYLVKPAYRSEQNYVSVRHLLVQFPEEETSTSEEIVSEPTTNEDGETTVPEETEPETHMHDGVAYEGAKHDDADGDTVYKETPKNNDDAKRIAEEYLAKYNEGEKTEEAFAALADLYSDDTSSTTDGGGEGGLIENMKPGQYVQPFEDWAYDEARKPGDVGIVETDYGYHVMYFVGAEEEPIWKTDIRNALASEKVTEETEADEEEYAGILTETSSMERAYRACVEFAASKRYS